MKRNALILILLVSWIIACNQPSKTTITAPKATPEVSPSAQKTVTQTGKTVDAIDATSIHANAVNDLDPAKKPLITGLTNARAEAVRAVEQATETHTLAVAKDAEAKESQAQLLVANREIGGLLKDKQHLQKENAEKDRKIKQIENDKAMRAMWLGIVLSVIASIAGGVLLANGSPKIGIGLIAGGVFGVGLCLMGMTLQHFFYTHEEEIGYGVGGLAVIALCAGGYYAFRRMQESTVAAAKLVQTGIITGAVDFQKLAPIARTIETPLLAKIVNKHTSKEDRELAVAASDLNGVGNLQGVA